MALRREIETLEPNNNTSDFESMYWRTIWEIAATNREGGFGGSRRLY